MHGYGGMGSGMVWYWIIGILALALVVWLIAKSAGQKNTPNQSKSALEILKERYAKGEIDKKEFEKRKKDLI